MKAAIGESLILGIILTFLSMVLLVLISSIVYTKAFRIKNRIVNEIETEGSYTTNVNDNLTFLFKEIGYKTNPHMNNTKCNDYTPNGGVLVNVTSAYHYCVFEMSSAKGGIYYKVVSFAYLEFPLISAIQIPVYGETKIFYSTI